MFFRKLNADDEAQFRAWARDNWKPHQECPSHYHPVVREEWAKIDNERLTAEDKEPDT